MDELVKRSCFEDDDGCWSGRGIECSEAIGSRWAIRTGRVDSSGSKKRMSSTGSSRFMRDETFSCRVRAGCDDKAPIYPE